MVRSQLAEIGLLQRISSPSHRHLIRSRELLGADGSHPPQRPRADEHRQTGDHRRAGDRRRGAARGRLPDPAAARGREHALRRSAGLEIDPSGRSPAKTAPTVARIRAAVPWRAARTAPRTAPAQVVDSAFVPGTAGTAVAPLPVTPAAPTASPRASPTTPRRSPTTRAASPARRTPTSIRTRSRGSPSSFADADARGRSRRAADPGYILPRVDRIPVALRGGRGDRSRARCAQIAVRRRADPGAGLVPDPARGLDRGIGARPARGAAVADRRPGRDASSSATSTAARPLGRAAARPTAARSGDLDQLFDAYLRQSARRPTARSSPSSAAGVRRQGRRAERNRARSAFDDVAAARDRLRAARSTRRSARRSTSPCPCPSGGEARRAGRRRADRGRARPGRERGPDRDRRLDRRPAARLAVHLARRRTRDRAASGAVANRADDHRDRPLGPDPGPRRRRDRRARAHLQRHARPARDRVRRPEGLPRRRRPRAAHADHGDPRAPRDPGRLTRGSARRRSR